MKLAGFALGLLALSAPVFADAGSEAHIDAAVIAAPSESLALAREYFALLPSDQYVDVLKASARMMADFDQIEDVALRTSAEHAFDRVLDRATPQIREQVPAVYEAYAQAYAREFSPDELRDLIAFAKTPAGHRFNAMVAKFENDPGVVGANRRLMYELGPIMEDFAREMCAEQAARRVAAGDIKAKCSMA